MGWGWEGRRERGKERVFHPLVQFINGHMARTGAKSLFRSPQQVQWPTHMDHPPLVSWAHQQIAEPVPIWDASFTHHSMSPQVNIFNGRVRKGKKSEEKEEGGERKRKKDNWFSFPSFHPKKSCALVKYRTLTSVPIIILQNTQSLEQQKPAPALNSNTCCQCCSRAGKLASARKQEILNLQMEPQVPTLLSTHCTSL